MAFEQIYTFSSIASIVRSYFSNLRISKSPKMHLQIIAAILAHGKIGVQISPTQFCYYALNGKLLFVHYF